MEGRFLKAGEYAKQLRVSEDKVRGWISDGELNAINVGNAMKPQYRLRQSDITSIERSRSTQARAQKQAPRLGACQHTPYKKTSAREQVAANGEGWIASYLGVFRFFLT